ncbi:MAG: hypothetical protein V3T64_01605 [Myxococcota bacterium]
MSQSSRSLDSNLDFNFDFDINLDFHSDQLAAAVARERFSNFRGGEVTLCVQRDL